MTIYIKYFVYLNITNSCAENACYSLENLFFSPTITIPFLLLLAHTESVNCINQMAQQKLSSNDGHIALERLKAERSSWKKDHPVGFVAKPKKSSNGEIDYFTWNCKIPGTYIDSVFYMNLFHTD